MPNTETPALTSQVVMSYPDSRYTVRTYMAKDGRWVLIREVPASLRDVAQATLAGQVAYAE